MTAALLVMAQRAIHALHREKRDRIGGINSEFNRAEDYDFCLRLSEITQFYHLKKPLYYYRQHSLHTVQQQLDQILESQSAIAQALQRRGLSERFE